MGVAEGNILDDAASVGAPVLIGTVAVEVDGTDPTAVAAADRAFARSDLDRRLLVNNVHPHYFNQFTLITTVDADTAVVTAVVGKRAHITDIIIVTTQTAGLGAFTLTNDAGTAILGPIPMVTEANAGNAVPSTFMAHFRTPMVNETPNDQVEMDKTAGEDDWKVYIAGYYAP